MAPRSPSFLQHRAGNNPRCIRPYVSKLRRSEEELRRSEEELRRSEEELRRSEEKLRRSEEELRRCEEKLRRSEEELRRSEEELRQSVKELRRTVSELRSKDTLLRRRLLGLSLQAVDRGQRNCARQDLIFPVVDDGDTDLTEESEEQSVGVRK